ncbi:hypothetical protein KAU37_11555 [Candidatus Bipolaricaulota bacterium]|nr:hypothetical protein [Candidatus Bipolaricaulota bacterium]
MRATRLRHVVGTAGLRPLGDFFFRQAVLAGMPAAYVAFWLALFPYRPVEDITTTVFLILLPIFVFIEVIAFVWPMWSFHRVMVRQKRSLVAQADEIARRISTTQAELRNPTNPAQVAELNARLTLDLKLYEEMEDLPTWPLNKQIRRRFAAQNLILVAVPLLGRLDGGKVRGFTEQLLEIFGAG